MEVRNCKSCGTLFNYIGGKPICPRCKANLENKFQDVRTYINENKNATIAQVAEAMEVSVKQLKEWVREERLSFTDATGEVCCDNCGKAIKTGRYCEACKKKLTNTLESAYRKEEKGVSKTDRKTSAGRMRFLDN